MTKLNRNSRRIDHSCSDQPVDRTSRGSDPEPGHQAHGKARGGRQGVLFHREPVRGGLLHRGAETELLCPHLHRARGFRVLRICR